MCDAVCCQRRWRLTVVDLPVGIVDTVDKWSVDRRVIVESYCCVVIIVIGSKLVRQPALHRA